MGRATITCTGSGKSGPYTVTFGLSSSDCILLSLDREPPNCVELSSEAPVLYRRLLHESLRYRLTQALPSRTFPQGKPWGGCNLTWGRACHAMNSSPERDWLLAALNLPAWWPRVSSITLVCGRLIQTNRVVYY